jgi:hypothetical protein
MNTLEILNQVKKYDYMNNNFCGVYSIDMLPQKKIIRPCGLIVNTDKSMYGGSHWFGIFLPRIGPIEYFDSFGIVPQNEEVYEFFNKNGNLWTYNSKQIQSNKSQSCGKFCLLFLAFRMKNISFKYFINLFSDNKSYNENLVKALFEKFFFYSNFN